MSTNDAPRITAPWRAGAYVRRARLAPVAIVVAPALPLAGTALAALPGWLKFASLAWFALAYVVQDLGRDRGLRIQQELWAGWGGPPTTDGLRWRGARNRSITRDRHRNIRTVLGNSVRLPTELEEDADPEGADHEYEAVVSRLRDITRNNEPLLLRENAGYGFRRNCLGLKSWGIGVSAMSAIAAGVLFAVGPNSSAKGLAGITAAIGFLTTIYWLLAVNKTWVHRQAVSYAEALFAVISRRASEQSINGGIESRPPEAPEEQ